MIDTNSSAARTAALALLILAAGSGADPACAAEAKAGLWFGPVHLCRDTVAEAVAGVEEYSGQPTLTLTLASGLQPRLQRATARKVHRTIKIQLDGRVVQETRVREPITGTSLRLAGFSREETERLRTASVRAC
jgi:preprotein translocase subunit SecD